MKNQPQLIITLLAFSLFGATLSAAPLNPRDIPAKANWYCHVNLDQLAQGEIAEILEELDFLFFFETGEESPLKYFSDEDGNLKGGISAYSLAEDDSILRASGVKTKYQEGLLEKMAGADDYEVSTHGEYTIHSWSQKVENPKKNNSKQMDVFASFIDENNILMGKSKKSLEEALDYLNNGEKGIVAPANNQSVIVAKADLTKMESKGGLAKKLETLETQLNVLPDGALKGFMKMKAANQEAADSMTKMLEGMMAMAAYSDSGDWNPAESVKTNQKGSTITIDLSVPVKVLKKFRR